MLADGLKRCQRGKAANQLLSLDCAFPDSSLVGENVCRKIPERMNDLSEIKLEQILFSACAKECTRPPDERC
jgi:hypothetical protein